MFELVFLLLPIAAAYGYYMGRASVRNQRSSVKSAQNTNYLRGVEYLLNNENDRAVDKFIAYLNDSDPSFESSLALGNLFRKRGEVGKAISLHEALANNSDLEISENEISRLELARDFISAGLLDRAEIILQALVEIPRQRVEAGRLLVKVYEQERDYPQAISTALSMRQELGNSVLHALAHYYCETAQPSLIAGDYVKAAALYRQALDVYPKSIRARLCLCDVFLKQKKPEDAYQLCREVSDLSEHSGLLCLEIIRRCFENRADPKLRFALEDLVRKTKSAQAMVELVEVTELTSGREDAEVQLLSFVKEKPNLKIFSALMRLRSKDENAHTNEAILQLKSIVDAQIASNPRYTCSRCGFESKLMFWQCPSCKRWDSMQPIRGLDGD